MTGDGGVSGAATGCGRFPRHRHAVGQAQARGMRVDGVEDEVCLLYFGLRSRAAIHVVRGIRCGRGLFGTRAVMARLGNLFRLQISDVLWSSIRFLLELVPRLTEHC